MFALDLAILEAIKAAAGEFVAHTSLMGIPVGTYAITWGGLMAAGQALLYKTRTKTELKKQKKEITIPVNFKVGE